MGKQYEKNGDNRATYILRIGGQKMVLPLIPILGGVATFFTGAYVGTVVENATDSPNVQIQQATVTENKPLSRKDFLMAGALGVGAYFIYRKFFK